MIYSKSYSESTTKSGAQISTTSFSGRLNELPVHGEFVHEVSHSWKTSMENGLSSDGWRKEYVHGVSTNTTTYEVPRLRKLTVGRATSYTQQDIISLLQKIGVDEDTLWEMVDSHS